MLSVSHVVQGIIVDSVLAFITANIIINTKVKATQTTVNGWSATLKCGQPGNGILLRAARAKILPAASVAQESVYWTTTVDSAGQTRTNTLYWQESEEGSHLARLVWEENGP